MKTLILQRKPIELKVLKKAAPALSHFSSLVDESTKIVDKESGRTVIVYHETNGDRVLPEIIDSLLRIKYFKDWRTGGLPTISRIFGYMPRNKIRKDFCAAASLNSEEPQALHRIWRGALLAKYYYRLFNENLFEKHMELSKKVPYEYTLRDTPFTSGIANKNNQLRYHHDAGNFKDVWSAMFVFKKDCEGGYLSIPEYDVGLRLKDKSLLLFDGQSILHGVTPINLKSPSAYRISIVYYSLLQLWKCLSPMDELSRIRKAKTEYQRKRSLS